MSAGSVNAVRHQHAALGPCRVNRALDRSNLTLSDVAAQIKHLVEQIRAVQLQLPKESPARVSEEVLKSALADLQRYDVQASLIPEEVLEKCLSKLRAVSADSQPGKGDCC